MPPTPPELFEIHDVQIFRTGVWNETAYSIEDLDAMVAAADQVGFRVPIKLGHDTTVGAPAAGWVSNLRRVGDRLVADLTSLSRKVYDLIAQRAYDAISIEVFFDLQRGGRVFRRVLRGLALLGAEIPAVAFLPPLSSYLSYLSELQFARCASYTIATLEPAPALTMMVDGRQFWQRAGEALLALAEHRARDKRMSLSAAFHEVAAEHPEVRRAYSQKLKGA